MSDSATKDASSEASSMAGAMMKFMLRLTLFPLALACVFIVIPVVFTKIWFKRDE